MEPPLNPPLAGRCVRLDPLTAADEPGLWQALNHDEVWTWIPIGRPTHAEFTSFIDSQLTDNASGSSATWTVRDRKTNRVIGTSSYLAIRLEHRGVEIGATMYDPTVWGTGANIEAKLLMMQRGFETLGLQRIEFKTDARNVRSRGALAALPAQFEGILRRHMDTLQGVRDSAYYSVIADDWPKVKAVLKDRLASPTD
jgi:RimJ/RimL family protein N-acetyltransferase